ncbi:MAG TPA: DUF748 domain-containing protein [Steroidobacteraceae bacterium]|jgi:hypothetical protein|nr:DUF748 domain-containing protein [Steroidobacteraceae bacterium]
MVPVINTRARIILTAVLAVLLLGYTLFGFFGVPRLLRSQAIDFVAAKYHRKIEIGEIRFNPFTLVLNVQGLSFPDSEGQPLLGFQNLLVNLNLSSVFHLAPSLADIELDEPFTRVVIRKDGTLNLADLAQPFDTAQAPPSVPEEPLQLAIERLRVSAGKIDFEDHARATAFRTRLAPIAFELRDFATVGKAGNAYALRATSAADERFAWSGSFALTPFSSRGTFEIANLHASTLWSYLRDALAFEITDGMIDLGGDYEFAARESELKLNVKNVTVANLALKGTGSAEEDVKVGRLQLINTRLDLKRRRVDIEKTSLSGAALRARRDAQGRINLLTLAGAAEAPPDAEATTVAGATATPAPSPWVLAAPDISIEGASVDVEDSLVKPAATFRLAPIDMKIAGFSNAPGTKVQIDAKLGIDESAKLVAKAEVVPDTSVVAGHVDISDFKLKSIQPYLGAYTQMTLSSGALSAGLDLKRGAQGALTIAGDIDVAKLHTIDNALKQEFITWDRLRVSGLEYSSEPARLRIATIAADSPYARLIIAPDQTTNVSKVLSAPAGSMPAPIQTVQKASGAQQASPPPLRVSIGAVRIVNGAANFADFWIQPNYAVNLQNMNGGVLGLSSDSKSRAKVEFEGKVDRYAPAKIAGEINLLSAALYTDLKVSFKGVELTSVTPYSGRFAGYKIEKGKLSIDVAYLVENRTLTAKQRFVIDQLELGERVESPDAVKLPLRLAVALLKDRNGIIDIDLPMSGSLDDPHFRMGPLIWKALVGLITKAATAPFALLGGLFGGGETMNQIEFEAGEATLDAAGQQKIATIGKALNERPGLQLEIPTTYSPDLDRAVLSSRQLAATLRALPKADDEALADPARRFELLLAQYQLDYGRAALPAAALALNAVRKSAREPQALPLANAELEKAIGEKHPVTDRDLEQLGQTRARAIQDALLGAGGLDATRVFVLGANPSAPTENKKVRLDLSLK